jgi:hypothetical protein
VATKGPVPKRSSQRRRRNKVVGADLLQLPASAPVEIPVADPEWHPIARGWFESLGESAQSSLYEPSDWATARYVAEAMSRNLNVGQRFSANLFAAVMSAMNELLTTEGARRRARVEIERLADAEPAAVAIMERYRQAARDGDQSA